MRVKEERQILYGACCGNTLVSTRNEGVFVQKEFKTIEEQIQILKSRGLLIPNLDKAKKYLLSNNYYNIINGYSKPFLERHNVYLENATFDEVSHLYFFDKECKQTLFQAILDAEHHLKSSFAYHFAEMHQNNTEAYLDVNSYNHEYSLDIAYIITKLKKVIDKNKRFNNNSIYHYYHNYGEIPIWVLIDFLDFGTLFNLIKISPIQLQNKIARDMTEFIQKNNPNFSEHFPPAVMVSFIKNIHELRNICAHNKRLIYFKCRSAEKYFAPIHDKYGISRTDQRELKSVYTTFVSLQCFISDTEFSKLNNTLRQRMRKILKNHITSININNIVELLGFPNNWYELSSLPQHAID
ncbi:Abi family protein [Lactobacillus sp. LL6]|nr:Abi family protein [Lactobacillus sp. LL6]